MSAGILDGFQTIIPTAAAVLSEKRQILRLTQQEVADRAKITLRQYQRLESGERNILTSSFGLACRVIEALDMDVSKFYHGDYYLCLLYTSPSPRDRQKESSAASDVYKRQDYDRIEFYDEDHSDDEDRYNTIGDTSAGRISQKAEGALIGNIDQFIGKVNEILFVVYTERVRIEESGTKTDVTRLISARMATEFERGLYYGKNE